MNGIVANSGLPPARAILRGILILTCCVLSVSLVGAVPTRSAEATRHAVATDPADSPVDAQQDASPETDGAVLAALRLPVDRSLSLLNPIVRTATPMPSPGLLAGPAAASSPATSGRELLKDVKPVTATATPPARKYSVRWMEVTAYCACKKCCGPRAQGITASGRPVTFNGGRFVAADKAFSFNTKLLIPGYGDGQPVPVLDRGGAIKGDKLDVYFPTHAEAKLWGRRFIPVAVLN